MPSSGFSARSRSSARDIRSIWEVSVGGPSSRCCCSARTRSSRANGSSTSCFAMPRRTRRMRFRWRSRGYGAVWVTESSRLALAVISCTSIRSGWTACASSGSPRRVALWLLRLKASARALRSPRRSGCGVDRHCRSWGYSTSHRPRSGASRSCGWQSAWIDSTPSSRWGVRASSCRSSRHSPARTLFRSVCKAS